MLHRLALIQFNDSFEFASNHIRFNKGGTVGLLKDIEAMTFNNGLKAIGKRDLLWNIRYYDTKTNSEPVSDAINDLLKAVDGANKLILVGTNDDVKNYLSFFPSHIASYEFPNLPDSQAATALEALEKQTKLTWGVYDDY
ncbi:hypothetical protein BKA57DRAFT_540963 [Linnemannia elongata]|nr:hypothetical protein BKA57DRAFT_540963 [Linnemannia elongata]